MTDRENVIKGLQCLLIKGEILWDSCENCPFGNSPEGCQYRINSDAIALLKAQEPLNAIKLRNIKTTFRDEIKFEYSCPNCYSYLMKGWKACPVCGQAVKWND